MQEKVIRDSNSAREEFFRLCAKEGYQPSHKANIAGFPIEQVAHMRGVHIEAVYGREGAEQVWRRFREEMEKRCGEESKRTVIVAENERDQVGPTRPERATFPAKAPPAHETREPLFALYHREKDGPALITMPAREWFELYEEWLITIKQSDALTDGCRSCRYWRELGSGMEVYACHYLLDKGRSRKSSQAPCHKRKIRR